jgi:transposase
VVSDGLWERIEPLVAPLRREPGGRGRPPVEDRAALCGILFVLHTGIQWEFLPQELGFGSGMTCWRRLRDWNAAGVWTSLHRLLLAELRGAGGLDFSRAVIDGSHVRALRRGPKAGRVRTTVPERARNIM